MTDMDENLEKELNNLEKKIEGLTDLDKLESVADIKPNNRKDLTDLLTESSSSPEKEINYDSLSEDELRKEILERIRNADSDKRNNLINKVAALKKINPSDRSFVHLSTKKRENLLKKLHEKRNLLGMKRKPKSVLDAARKQLVENLSDIKIPLNLPKDSDNGKN